MTRSRTPSCAFPIETRQIHAPAHFQPYTRVAGGGHLRAPFRENIREIMSAPLRMNSPWKATSMMERLGVEGSNMGSLPIFLVYVAARHTRLLDKGVDRPCSFFFMPWTFRYQMQKHVSTVWCSAFSGSTFEDFLAVFRGSDCVITDLFTHGGRGVQLWNSLRYLEFLCAVCATMDRGEDDGGFSPEVGNHYIRAAILMAGWFIHPDRENMTVKNDQSARFVHVQRDALGTTVPDEWKLGLARFLADGPDSLQESRGSRLSRSQVASTEGQYSCLAGSCGHGCGTPHCEADVCMHCTMLSMVWESCERRVAIERALRASKPTTWYMVPRVYTRPDLCLLHEAASPEVKGRFLGKSD